MAQDFGTQAHPADLGPFARIVKVHWAGTYLRVDYGFRLNSTPQGERGTGPGPALVEPFSEAFVREATAAFDPAEPGVRVSSGDQFVGVLPADVTVSGSPTLPSTFTYADWALQGANNPPNGLFAPFIRWLPLSGAHPDIRLPGVETWFTTMTGQGEVVGQPFISLPQPLPVGGDVPLWATFNPDFIQQNTFALDMSGVAATYKGRAYTAIALRVFDQHDNNTGQLQVLLKRQKAT